MQKFLHDSLSLLLDRLFVLGRYGWEAVSTPVVNRTGKMLSVAMVASCDVVDVQELQSLHVALFLELLGCFSAHPTILFLLICRGFRLVMLRLVKIRKCCTSSPM